MRTATSILLASLLCVSAAGADAGTLSPGKPAGVKQAQLGTLPFIYIAGAAVLITGIVLVASRSNSGTNAAALAGTLGVSNSTSTAP